MKIDQYCRRQRCKHVKQFLACFRVARVCQRELGFLVVYYQWPRVPRMHRITRAVHLLEHCESKAENRDTLLALLYLATPSKFHHRELCLAVNEFR